MSKQDYDLCAAEIEKIQNAAAPNIPVVKMLEEAEALNYWCQ